ncbi:MAG: hypothetical protein QM715_17615 [Nibricoccus sp.]
MAKIVFGTGSSKPIDFKDRRHFVRTFLCGSGLGQLRLFSATIHVHSLPSDESGSCLTKYHA